MSTRASLLVLSFLAGPLVDTATGQCIQSPSGLLHWWSGDRNSADLAGGNAGTLQNGVGYAAQVGSAFVFDGLDDFVISTQNSTLTGNPAFTIEGWLYVPSSARLTGVGYAPILWWGSPSTGSSVYFSLRAHERNRLFVGFHNGGQIMADTFTNDEWHHVAWVRAGGGRANQGNTLYIDGTEAPLQDDPAAPSNTATPDLTASPYYIQSASDGRFFEGMIDELGVYNRALSENEIQAIYDAGSEGKCKAGAPPGLVPSECTQPPAGLLSWWPGDGSADDLVGGNNGLAQGGLNFAAKVGSAFLFDGQNDHIVSEQDSTLTGNPSFTLETWLYVPSASRLVGPGYPSILWWGSLATGKSVYFGLRSNERNRLFVGFYNGGQHMVGTFTNDAWHHIAWVRTGGGAANQGNTLYIDGVSVPLVDDAAAPSNSGIPDVSASPYYIQNGGDGRYFECMIDELGIYDRALSQVEIQGICDAGSDGKCKSMYELFGTGCAGPTGIPTLDVVRYPWVNSPFAVELGNLPPGTGIAYVVFGFSNTIWAGIPLPADLGQLGIPGCTVYVSVEVAVPVLAAGGKAPLAFQIPLDTSLNGLAFYNQGAGLTPPVVTNAGVGVIGLK